MRIFGMVLTVTVLCLLAKNLFGEQSITIEVVPKVVTTYPYNPQTFRVRVHILRNKDNRLWSYSGSCGSEIKSSDHDLDVKSPLVYEWYEEFTVTDDCIFQACLHRLVEKKIKNVCVYQAITTEDF